MPYLPKNVLTNILEFCDDRVERKQKKLWGSIKIDRIEYFHDGNIYCIDYNGVGGETLMEQTSYDIDNWEGICLNITLASDEYWNNRIRQLKEELF